MEKAKISQKNLREMIRVRLEKKFNKKPFNVHKRGFAFAENNNGALEAVYSIIIDCCESEDINITECSADDGFGSDRWTKLIAVNDGMGYVIMIKYENGVLEITLK